MDGRGDSFRRPNGFGAPSPPSEGATGLSRGAGVHKVGLASIAATTPPSTSRSVPVMKDASGPTRN